MNDKIKLATSYWIPTIMKVENGYIVSILSPKSDLEINETYVFNNYIDCIAFIEKNFKECGE